MERLWTRPPRFTRGEREGGCQRYDKELAVFLDKANGVIDRGDLFRGFIGDFDTEFFFKGHHQFDLVEAVSTEIVGKAGVRSYLVLIYCLKSVAPKLRGIYGLSSKKCIKPSAFRH
jgi:hypothetical protein